MHKRMRRGKEMYPSFDTRRVLCKQHRPYCVKPLRARLKPSIAKIAVRLFSVSKAENFAVIAQTGAGWIELEAIKKYYGI